MIGIELMEQVHFLKCDHLPICHSVTRLMLLCRVQFFIPIVLELTKNAEMIKKPLRCCCAR